MAAIGADAPAPAPAPPVREDAPTERQSKAPVKAFDLQKQPNATRRAPEAHRVPPSRTAKDAEAEDSDEDEYLHGSDQHEGLAQFINRSRDYEPALPADVVGLVALATDHFLASLINEAGEAAALRGDSAEGGRRVLRTADVMAALQQRGVDAMNGPAPTGGKKRARGA
jgi:hypothetical protein